MFEISIKAGFCGAHNLSGYDGPCAHVHGHNWEVEIYLRGDRVNRLGMLADFRRVKQSLRKVLDKFDHKNLNALPVFRKTNPTSENIARLIFDGLQPEFHTARCRLCRVRVSESAGTSAIYSK